MRKQKQNKKKGILCMDTAPILFVRDEIQQVAGTVHSQVLTVRH